MLRDAETTSIAETKAIEKRFRAVDEVVPSLNDESTLSYAAREMEVHVIARATVGLPHCYPSACAPYTTDLRADFG